MKLQDISDKVPFEPILAILLGCGIGFLCAGKIKNHLSNLAVERCKGNSLYQLVEINDFLGTQKYCVSRTAIYGPGFPLKP